MAAIQPTKTIPKNKIDLMYSIQQAWLRLIVQPRNAGPHPLPRRPKTQDPLPHRYRAQQARISPLEASSSRTTSSSTTPSTSAGSTNSPK